MQDFEKLGVFYLGREYDYEKGEAKDDLLLYDSKDLVTHAVCVGMTGSGKTGLCIGLLEEAAIDGIPAIIVDPKGDLTNLLLTFPNLKPEDFRPWINEDDARRKDMSPDDFAAAQATLWTKGLAEWGQDGARIQKLRDTADFAIYTPGSSAGTPISILNSFAAPGPEVAGDNDLLRERIGATVTSLLSFLDIDPDPIQSREHILLSTILDTAWRQGQDLDLTTLIQSIQSPPVTRIGVFELDSFFPAKDRFGFAMKVNSLLAAPGFAAWLEGEPLDINRLLHTDQGKPRICVLSISHLNPAERMFFVSLLLTQLLGWMRGQSGTTSLRAIFYMDEIFGYFPAVANPPSKTPLLTLLKQARAFGLGIVLATQNPVDLDYKGLSNTGTWFIGRLQTERDKMRVLEGLESAGTSGLSRNETEQLLSGLGQRVFLMRNVNEDRPVVFQTRWAMSYLRGPLTRDQIKRLTTSTPSTVSTPSIASRVPTASTPSTPSTPPAPTAPEGARPILDPAIPERFLPVRGGDPGDTRFTYVPMLTAFGKVYYANATIGIATEMQIGSLAELPDGASRPDWDSAEKLDLKEDELETTPYDPAASFRELPATAGNKKSYPAWEQTFQDWLYRNQRLELLKSATLKEVSKPGENEREFRIRLQLAAREKRDAMTGRLRAKYAARFSSLEERIRRAQYAVHREAEQAKQQKLSTAVSLGATILGAFLGRKTISASTLGRASTAARGTGRMMKETQDIKRAQDNVVDLQAQLTELQSQLDEEINLISTQIDPLTEELETVQVTPRKSDLSVLLLSLVWVPYRQEQRNQLTRAW